MNMYCIRSPTSRGPTACCPSCVCTAWGIYISTHHSAVALHLKNTAFWNVASFCILCIVAMFELIKIVLIYLWYSNIYPTRCNVTQFILSGNCSTCFGLYHHPSSGAQTTVSTASGICHTVTAICRYCGRVGTADSSNGVTNTRCCRYSCFVPLKMGDSETRNM